MDLEDKNLEEQEVQTSTQSENTDFIQKNSENVARLQSTLKAKEKETTSKEDAELPLSEIARKKALAHISDVEQALKDMRERGDYGDPAVDNLGKAIEGDFPFLEKDSEIPEDLKSQMD